MAGSGGKTWGSFGAFAAAFKPGIPITSPEFVLAENRNKMHAGERDAAVPRRLSPGFATDFRLLP
jgi:hypothetical protein